MSRTVTLAVAEALNAGHVTACHLIEIQFGSGTVRVTEAPYDITWGVNTYSGFGRAGTVEGIRESAESEATGLRLSLAGPIAAYLSLALQEPLQGDPVNVWVTFFDANHQIIPDPVLEFAGRADTMSVSESAGQSTIVLTAESRFADFARPRVRRFNDADQQAQYPGDKGFEYLPQMVEKTIIWPAKSFFAK